MTELSEPTLLSREAFKRAASTSLAQYIMSRKTNREVYKKINLDTYPEPANIYTFMAHDKDEYKVACLRIQLSILLHAKACLQLAEGNLGASPSIFAIYAYAEKNIPFFNRFQVYLKVLEALGQLDGYPLHISIPSGRRTI